MKYIILTKFREFQFDTDESIYSDILNDINEDEYKKNFITIQGITIKIDDIINLITESSKEYPKKNYAE